jgi:hypothetical protein
MYIKFGTRIRLSFRNNYEEIDIIVLIFANYKKAY